MIKIEIAKLYNSNLILLLNDFPNAVINHYPNNDPDFDFRVLVGQLRYHSKDLVVEARRASAAMTSASAAFIRSAITAEPFRAFM